MDMNKMMFENENARLLVEPVKEYYPDLDVDEITEEMALAMYFHATTGKIPLINNKVVVPVYNLKGV